jgi:hypothetical protein
MTHIAMFDFSNGHSLPIDPNGYVRFDQLRTWAKLRIRRDGPQPASRAAKRLGDFAPGLSKMVAWRRQSSACLVLEISALHPSPQAVAPFNEKFSF